MKRLFAGIELDDAARRACANAIEQLRRTGFAAKFEDIGKLHVTLAFLGNVDERNYDAVTAAMNESASATPPFSIVLDRLGAFPHERKPRIVYVGTRDRGAAYRSLSARLRDAYGRLGFSFTDDAVAHVTIARVKNPRRPLPLVEPSPAILQVETLTLFESIFDKERNTSRYVVSATSRLSS